MTRKKSTGKGDRRRPIRQTGAGSGPAGERRVRDGTGAGAEVGDDMRKSEAERTAEPREAEREQARRQEADDIMRTEDDLARRAGDLAAEEIPDRILRLAEALDEKIAALKRKKTN